MMLREKADSYARSLSGGMKRRLLVAKNLCSPSSYFNSRRTDRRVDVDETATFREYSTA